MNKVSIMQPYFFPYIGYFQLIHKSDIFVFYDDVNYRKGGRINRNFILNNGNTQMLTLPLAGASPNKLINEITISGNRKKILNNLEHAYKKSSEFNKIFPLIEHILFYESENLSSLLINSLREICKYLNINN